MRALALLTAREEVFMQEVLFLADADPQWRDVCQRILAQCGFILDMSTDGLTCLARVRARQPTVLIVDLDIPWGGGEGVLACLREESRLPAVVIVTGSSSPDALSERTGIPPSHCLRKPFHVDTLLNLLQSAIRLHTGMAPTEARPAQRGAAT
jgi:DNA-binding NtrC family response regulator